MSDIEVLVTPEQVGVMRLRQMMAILPFEGQ